MFCKFLPKGLFIVFLLLFFCISCKQSNPFEVDISGVPEEPVNISRYEKALFQANPYDLLTDLQPYMDEFSFFLGNGTITEEGRQQLFEFVTEPFLQELFFDVIETYPSLEFLEDQMANAYRYYRYYYPKEKNPKAFSYVSGIDYMMPIKYADGHLIIALDMYLGRNYQNYERAGIPVFKRIGYTKDYIVADIMRVMAEKNIPDEVKIPSTFLDFMVHEGKILYFLDLMMPHTHDTIKIEYSGRHIEWAERNTKFIWTYFIDNELLYSKDRQMIQQFVGDAPFTVIFTERSAPRAGVWIGWQIVREYMKKNPQVTIQDLLEEKSSQEILNKSGFRPR